MSYVFIRVPALSGWGYTVWVFTPSGTLWPDTLKGT